jgi:hypothetical protein
MFIDTIAPVSSKAHAAAVVRAMRSTNGPWRGLKEQAGERAPHSQAPPSLAVFNDLVSEEARALDLRREKEREIEILLSQPPPVMSRPTSAASARAIIGAFYVQKSKGRGSCDYESDSSSWSSSVGGEDDEAPEWEAEYEPLSESEQVKDAESSESASLVLGETEKQLIAANRKNISVRAGQRIRILRPSRKACNPK